MRSATSAAILYALHFYIIGLRQFCYGPEMVYFIVYIVFFKDVGVFSERSIIIAKKKSSLLF